MPSTRATQSTVLVPTGKSLPEGGVHSTWAGRVLHRLFAVSSNSTAATPLGPAEPRYGTRGHTRSTQLGQAVLTMTGNSPRVTRPAASTTEQATELLPGGNRLPEEGKAFTWRAPPQLSVAVTANSTTAPWALAH